MSPAQRRFVAGVLALLALAFFVGLYVYALAFAWRSHKADEKLSDAAVYFGTILSGLIGGVVAMIFNEKLPDAPGRSLGGDAAPPPPPHPPAAPGDATAVPPQTPSASGLRAGKIALETSIKPTSGDALSYISVAYVLVYFLAGMAALITFIIQQDKTPEVVKNLALVSIGLLVAVARSFFNVPAAA
jgi:hypothetical protein